MSLLRRRNVALFLMHFLLAVGVVERIARDVAIDVTFPSSFLKAPATDTSLEKLFGRQTERHGKTLVVIKQESDYERESESGISEGQ